MSIAILCPGPSLPDVWCDDFQPQHSLIVAINTVAWHYACDWMGGSDNHVLGPLLKKKRSELPRIGFITARRWRGHIQPLGKRWELPHLSTPRNCAKEVQKLSNSETCGYTFPSTYAWVRANYPGRKIEVYGFDCAVGSLDFCQTKGDHSENRWIQELLWLQSVWLRGTVVHGRASAAVLNYLERR